MSVLYYDKSEDRPVDKDGKYIYNWNPYGKNEDDGYAHVYFRLDSKYKWGEGWTEEEEEEFNKEIKAIFPTIGWTIIDRNKSYECNEAFKGKAGLYIHPMEITGILLKKDIKTVAELLDAAKTFKLRWVDVYNDVYDMSDEEYEKYLETKRDNVVDYLLHHCGTNRTYKYLRKNNICEIIRRMIKVDRIGDEDRRWSVKRDDLAEKYISKVIDELVEQGYMIGKERNTLIRTINKTEQKKLHLEIA